MHDWECIGGPILQLLDSSPSTSSLITVKGILRSIESEYYLWRGIRRFRGELRNGTISLEAITEIWLGWGNHGYSCSVEALHELATLAVIRRNGILLELGGGVSTLVLSIVSEFTKQRVVTLEHEAEWSGRLQGVLQHKTAGQFEVRYAPLVPFGNGVWYSPDRLPDLTDVTLVFVDGPPGQTPGGRNGALEFLARQLPHSAAILLDDTNRDPERQLSLSWAELRQLDRHTYTLSRDRSFDVLMPHATS